MRRGKMNKKFFSCIGVTVLLVVLLWNCFVAETLIYEGAETRQEENCEVNETQQSGTEVAESVETDTEQIAAETDTDKDMTENDNSWRSMTSEGKYKYIDTTEEDMQGNIIGYTLTVSQTGHLTYQPDSDYLIPNGKVGRGVYESEHMSVVTAYLGQMLVELLECRGKVSEEKRQYFSEYALWQMTETDWTLLDDNWNADPFAYFRDYQMNPLIQGYDFTYYFFPRAETVENETTQRAVIYLSVDGEGIVRGIKIEIIEESSEKASMRQFVSLTGLYDDEYKEWIICDGEPCQENILMDFSRYYQRWQEDYDREKMSTAVSCAEETAEMVLDMLKSRGAHAGQYRAVFGSEYYESIFQEFANQAWNQLGEDWIVSERYDCECIDRTEIGYVGFRYYFYPDYEAMGAEHAEAVVFECNVIEEWEICYSGLTMFDLTKEEYETARQTRSQKGNILIEDGKRVEEGWQIYIPVPDTEEPYGILLKEFDFDETEENAGVSVVGQELWGYTNLSEAAAFLGEKMQGDFENEELRERDLETGETVTLFEDEDTFPDYKIELFFERAGEGWKASEAYDCYYIKENERADCIHLRYYFYPQTIEGEEETVLATDVYVSVQGIVDMQLNSYTRNQGVGTEKESEKIIQQILEENHDTIDEFFEMYPKSSRWIQFSCFDFTKDGCMEIIFSKEHVETDSTIISYNYVYDCHGNKLLEFLAGDISDIGIFHDEDDNVFYVESKLHVAAHDDITLYEEIVASENMGITISFAEWDMRDGRQRNDNQKEAYFVFDSFTEDEEQYIWEQGMKGILEILNKKEAKGTFEKITQYVSNLKRFEKKEVELWGSMYDWEKGMEFIEQ